MKFPATWNQATKVRVGERLESHGELRRYQNITEDCGMRKIEVISLVGVKIFQAALSQDALSCLHS